MSLAESLQKTSVGLFPETLGVRFLEASADGVRGEMDVPRAMCTLPGRMHGGAIMALADTLGAYATAINLPEGANTTTIESKTNFFAAGLEGGKVVGTATALHKGRRTMVWQTRIEREDGRLVAVVTQTQIVLPKELSPAEQMIGLFAGMDTAAQQALLAQLERSGGGLYRAWAEAEANPERKQALLDAAEREDVNAAVLEGLATEA